MKRTILWLALPMLLASASAACADRELATSVPSIEVGPVEASSTTGGQGETRELTVTVGTGAESRQFVVRAPSNLLDRGEKAKAQVVDEHLLVYTRSWQRASRRSRSDRSRRARLPAGKGRRESSR